MEGCVFQFQIPSHYEIDVLLPQVSRALEKRTEMVSRSRYPGIWKVTDRFAAVPRKGRRSKRRTRVMSILCLALGLFLLIPGLMDPRELWIPLLTGACAVGAGIGGLWRGRRSGTSRFDRAARVLLEGAPVPGADPAAVSFCQTGMTLPGSGESADAVPYSCFECVMETADGFLLVFGTRALVMKKQDLTSGTVGDFRTFMMEKAAQYQSV